MRKFLQQRKASWSVCL